MLFDRQLLRKIKKIIAFEMLLLKQCPALNISSAASKLARACPLLCLLFRFFAGTDLKNWNFINLNTFLIYNFFS